MQATAIPNPFPATSGFQVHVTGGQPPYSFTPFPVPPNPEGVQVSADGWVTVPADTPRETVVKVYVYDSGNPQQTTQVAAYVG